MQQCPDHTITCAHGTVWEKEGTMIIATNDITAKGNELQELRKMTDELNAEIEKLTDEIKAFMSAEELMYAGAFKVSYKPVTTQRIDTTSMKKELPDLVQRYMKTTTSRRFSIN